MEFFFAVAAIAIALGAYLHQLVPFIPIKTLTYICLTLIILINMKGLSESITLEIITTLLALTGLIVFSYAIANKHELTALRSQIHSAKTLHIFTAIPYLLWLFLGIEGSVLTSKECTTPHTTLPKAIKLAMITLTLTAILTVVQTAIMLPQQLNMSDPLPSLLTHTHKPSWMITLISLLGACGLLASLNGLMIAASRQLHGLVERVSATKVLSQADSQQITRKCTAIIGILLAIIINIIPESQLLYISIMAAICIYILGAVTCMYNKKLDNTSFNLSKGISIYVLLTGILLLILMIKKT
jgi:ethanolamine permease